MEISKSYLTNLIYRVTGAAIEVHKQLGPGFLESVYQKCLAKELSLRGINYQSEVIVRVDYKGISLDTQLRCDFLIEGILPVELKSVEGILPVHEAQLLTYMKLLEAPKGLLINFNVVHLNSQGQRAYVNELYRNLPE